MGEPAQAVPEDVPRVLIDELRSTRDQLAQLARLINPKGMEFEAVNKLELAALRQLVVAARRVRMLKGEGGTQLQLFDALRQLDEVLDAAEPGAGRKRPPG